MNLATFHWTSHYTESRHADATRSADELAHLLERHHNERFIALMNAHRPHWRRHRATLNRSPLSIRHAMRFGLSQQQVHRRCAVPENKPGRCRL